MAVKLTLTDISSGYQGSDIQANFVAIEDEFDKVVYRDGSLAMSGNLDMNSQRLVNLPPPTSSTEPLRKDDQFTSAEAQSYAADAETAKDAAETALETFQSQYVGESATDPTTDGNGDALAEGALYFDTTNNLLKAYDGSSWVVSANQYFPNVDANVTATEDELNILDGATITTAELNVLDDFYEEATHSLDGDFTSGGAGIRRLGDTVTIHVGSMGFTDATAVSTSTAFPAQFRPFNTVTFVVGSNGTFIQSVDITASGHITVYFRDWTGSSTSTNTSALASRFAVTYVVT